MGCRADKYVWSVRLAKTRSKATEAIAKGKIKLNNELIKPAREVRLGDEIQVIRNTATFTYRIISLLDRRIGAKLVKDYIIDITPEDELIKYREYQANQKVYRNHGEGKPTKKQRRDIDDFLENW